MENAVKALKALGVKGSIHMYEVGSYRDLIRVELNGTYFGLFDSARRLFVD